MSKEIINWDLIYADLIFWESWDEKNRISYFDDMNNDQIRKVLFMEYDDTKCTIFHRLCGEGRIDLVFKILYTLLAKRDHEINEMLRELFMKQNIRNQYEVFQSKNEYGIFPFYLIKNCDDRQVLHFFCIFKALDFSNEEKHKLLNMYDYKFNTILNHIAMHKPKFLIPFLKLLNLENEYIIDLIVNSSTHYGLGLINQFDCRIFFQLNDSNVKYVYDLINHLSLTQNYHIMMKIFSKVIPFDYDLGLYSIIRRNNPESRHRIKNYFAKYLKKRELLLSI